MGIGLILALSLLLNVFLIFRVNKMEYQMNEQAKVFDNTAEELMTCRIMLGYWEQEEFMNGEEN